MKVITADLDEGKAFNRWMYNRIFKKNQNVLGVDIGGTGSGKSYRQLRVMELWYTTILNKPFPADNICFEPYDIVEKLSGDTLKKGDMLIYEEAGTTLGSKDFMEKRQKMFNYIMQSFRFRNIIIMFNLPNLAMLSKDTRRMLHICFESAGIDYDKKINYCKPFQIQESARMGKTYFHYPKRIVNGRQAKIKRFGYSMPSPPVIDLYEIKKEKYFNKLNSEVQGALLHDKNKREGKLDTRAFTNEEMEYLELFKKKMLNKDIAKLINRSERSTSRLKNRFMKYNLL